MQRVAASTLIIGMLFPVIAAAAPLTRPLTVGSRGADVTTLQEILFNRGFLSVSPTGYFGALTKQAVAAFQTAHELEPIGSVGPKTRALMNSLLAAPAISMPTTPSDISPPVPQEPLPVTATSSVSTPSPAPVSGPDMTPPVVTVISPTSQLPYNTLDTIMEIQTDEPANCRWGTLPNMLTGSMTAFTYTGSTRHTRAFTNLARGSLYVYYVRCEDTRLNTSSDVTVSFSVQATSGRLPGRSISFAMDRTQVAAVTSSEAGDVLLHVLTMVFPPLALFVH